MFETYQLLPATLERYTKTGTPRICKIPAVTSTATFVEKDDVTFFRRNLYFANLIFFFQPKKKVATFQLRDKKTGVVQVLLKITPDAILYYKRSGNVFRQGINCIKMFFADDLRKQFPQFNEDDGSARFHSQRLYAALKNEMLHLVKLTCKAFNYKSLFNCYYKFYNLPVSATSLDQAVTYPTKTYCYKQLRKCRGLRQLSMFLFRSKDKCYRDYLNKMMTHKCAIDDALMQGFYTLYMLTRYAKLKASDIIKIKPVFFINAMLGIKTFVPVLKKAYQSFSAKQLTDYFVVDGGYQLMVLDKMQELRDTITLRDGLKKEELAFVKSLELPIVEEHDLLSYLERNNQNKKIYQLPRYEELDKLDGKIIADDWKIILPNTTLDLIRWGNKNDFCIAMYDKSIINGRCYCIGVVNTITNELYCAELFNDYGTNIAVSQFQGFANKEAPRELRLALGNVLWHVRQEFERHEEVEIKQLTTDDKNDTFKNKVYRYLTRRNNIIELRERQQPLPVAQAAFG